MTMNDSPDHLAAIARLEARLHDPPEKALVLMRTPEGHEGGTVRALRDELFPQGTGPAIAAAVHRADHWSSAADRAAFPKADTDGRHPSWQQIRFASDPVLIHPLTGAPHRLQPLDADIPARQAQALATDHLRQLVHREAGEASGIDVMRTALAFWRFGPELAGELSSLWALLPADGRVPDHTIHDHLDLAAAMAGAFAADPEGGPALMAISIGPVQDFIAAARSTTDLWAGSHLLARMSWEAMRVVCEACGPESVLFPRLRANPLVDLWLQQRMGVRAELFDGCEWREGTTDANPLYIAALPNRFTALVPANRVQALGEAIEAAVRSYAKHQAESAFRMLLEEAGMADDPGLPGYAQIDEQLRGFPEVHWVGVPWSVVKEAADGTVDSTDAGLRDAMQPFFDRSGTATGHLDSAAWKLLSRGLTLENGWFYRPNPGALYPALHELVERAMAALKTQRHFVPTTQEGWRCSLTGEAEWITTDRAQLLSYFAHQQDTLWARVATRRPEWARPGEHLSALPMLKRLWPQLFAQEIGGALPSGAPRRFVVSTHTMAITSAIEAALEGGLALPEDLTRDIARADSRVALPRRLARRLARDEVKSAVKADAWRGLPGWLESCQEAGDAESERARSRLARALGTKPDAYYGLLLMDGDHMGAWLSASAPGVSQPVAHSFHPTLQQRLGARFEGDPAFVEYARSSRTPNPAWHMAISDALNHFSLQLARDVVEDEHGGRMIYAGGDDVLAMLPTRSLLPAAKALRYSYSGTSPDSALGVSSDLGRGWGRRKGRILRLMGPNATASCGLVIAHHQAPIGSVMQILRATEQRAKGEGQRDAWSLSVVKRSGGLLQVTARWGEPLALFEGLRDFLAQPGVSRRAAYHATEWLHQVPPDSTGPNAAFVQRLLAHQMQRQCIHPAQKREAARLADEIVSTAFDARKAPAAASRPLDWLRDFMLAAEFLAREDRHDDPARDPSRRAAAAAPETLP